MQYEHAFSLPKPDADSTAHSARCAEYIRERIGDAGGSTSFAEFMHYALYAPGLGYYSAGARKFGAGGDFVTAPEVSALFATVLARQTAQAMRPIDNPAVLELGAGSGRLAVDLLRALSGLGALPDEYRIIEVSADLRERQCTLLHDEVADYHDRIVWLERLPDEHRGVIIANEVLDALPVERFLRKDDGIRQLRVTCAGDGFVFVDEPAPAVLVEAVEAIEADIGRTLPQHYVSEVCLAAPAWLRDIAASLAHGLVFLFDYGVSRREYYAPDRDTGWLQCHFRHRAHNDPLILPGIQDITAWVDFTAVAKAAIDAGLVVAGYVSQSQFLLAGGLEQELRDFAELPPESQLEVSGQVKILTLPGEMGENIKCIGLGRGAIGRPDAFESADRTHTL